MSRNDHAAAAIAEWAQTLVDASVGLDVGRIAEVSTCPKRIARKLVLRMLPGRDHALFTPVAHHFGGGCVAVVVVVVPFHTRGAPFWWRLRGVPALPLHLKLLFWRQGWGRL